MNFTNLRLRLGISQESFEKLIEFMPEVKELDSNDKIISFMGKYIGESNCENNDILVESFIKEFNRQHQECQLIPQLCELCEKKYEHIATDICQYCKKHICKFHSKHYKFSEEKKCLPDRASIVCPHCYDKIEESQNNNDTLPKAGFWLRFLARMLDLAIFSFFVSFILIFIPLPSNFNLFSLANIIGVLLVCFLEILFYSIFLNTPGKALVGIYIVDKDNKKLSRSRFVLRNIKVHCDGLGLGIPLVSTILSIQQLIRLCKNKPTTYDAKLETKVVLHQTSFLRIWLAFILIIILFLMFYKKSV